MLKLFMDIKINKRALKISCYVAGGGAFGVFLRWLQDQLAFNEAGLPDPSGLHVIVPLYILAAAFVYRHFVKGYAKEGFVLPESFADAFANAGKLYSLVRWVIGLLLFVGGVMLLMTSETDKYAGMLRVLSIVAMLSGIAFPLLMANANRRDSNPNLNCFLAFLPILLYAVWLVYCYRANSINPVVWSFVLEVFTVIMAMVAFFRVAGFPFQNPKSERCLFDAMFAAMLCLTSMADERYMGMQILLFASALMLGYENCVMVCNLRKAEEVKKEAPVQKDNGGFEQLT